MDCPNSHFELELYTINNKYYYFEKLLLSNVVSLSLSLRKLLCKVVKVKIECEKKWVWGSKGNPDEIIGVS